MNRHGRAAEIDWRERSQREHERRMRNLNRYRDDGQPTAEDLAEIDRQRAQAAAQFMRDMNDIDSQQQDAQADTRRTMQMLVATVLVIALCAASLFWMGYARAATHAAVTLASYHPDREYAERKQLQDFTPGIGIEHDTRVTLLGTPVRALAGVQRNSYWGTPSCAGRSAWRCGLSVYAGAAWQPVTVLGVKAGVAAGGITAYPINDGGVSPMLVGLVSAERGAWGVNLVLAPKVADKSHGAISLQIKRRLA